VSTNWVGKENRNDEPDKTAQYVEYPTKNEISVTSLRRFLQGKTLKKKDNESLALGQKRESRTNPSPTGVQSAQLRGRFGKTADAEKIKRSRGRKKKRAPLSKGNKKPRG